MAVETLRPNAAGDDTDLMIGGDTPAPTNWQSVDEVIADDSTTEVYASNDDFYSRDLYNLPASSGSGAINFIKIYFRCRSFTGSTERAKPSLKSNGTVTDGTEISPTTGYVTYSEQWATNPVGGQPWGWSDIDDLQIGVSLKPGQEWVSTYCTQVYVEIDYTPLVEKSGSDTIEAEETSIPVLVLIEKTDSIKTSEIKDDLVGTPLTVTHAATDLEVA